MRHAARHGWILSQRRNLALAQMDTEGEAGLARAEHEEEVSVTTSAFFQIARSRPRFWTRVAEAACAVSVIKVAKF